VKPPDSDRCVSTREDVESKIPVRGQPRCSSFGDHRDLNEFEFADDHGSEGNDHARPTEAAGRESFFDGHSRRRLRSGPGDLRRDDDPPGWLMRPNDLAAQRQVLAGSGAQTGMECAPEDRFGCERSTWNSPESLGWDHTQAGRSGGYELEQLVNDVHSRLNSTKVLEIVRPTGIDVVRETVLRVGRENAPGGGGLAVWGGRHAMGGQQFGSGSLLLDMSGMNGAFALDEERALLTIEAGAMWPDAIRATQDLSHGNQRFSIRQKQTGADTLTIGGAIACNAHGRG
jgi:hypothetical protein